MPKKILHIIESLAIGGAEKLLVNVINDLVDDYEHHLILLHPPDTLVSQLPPSCKVTIIDFQSARSLWKASRQVRKYIRQHGIDIVHSHLYWAHLITRLAAPKKVKVFNSIHAINSESTYKVNILTLYLDKLTYRKRHHIIAVSNEVLKDFDKWVGLRGKSTVLYNMIEDKFFIPAPKTAFSQNGLRMVAVGNLRYQKNYPYLIEAFKTMPANVSLDIYGEGDLRAELQSAIDTHKLNIRLLGHHHALETLLPDYDAFIMCSFYEGFSLGLMEAMACGLPPILSDIPVLEEAAGDCGIYIDINDPLDLTRKAEQMLNGKIGLVNLAQKAHARAQAMARKDIYLKKLNDLYKNVKM